MSTIKFDPASKSPEEVLKTLVLADYKHILVVGETQDGHMEVSCSDMNHMILTWFIAQLNKWYYNK